MFYGISIKQWYEYLGVGVGGTPSVRVSRDVPPFRPPFFTSGTPSGWVFKCQTYSCWVSYFFVLSYSPRPIYVKFSYLATLFGSFLWKFDTPVGVEIHPADTPVGVKIWKFNPWTPHPYPFRAVTSVYFIATSQVSNHGLQLSHVYMTLHRASWLCLYLKIGK